MEMCHISLKTDNEEEMENKLFNHLEEMETRDNISEPSNSFDIEEASIMEQYADEDSISDYEETEKEESTSYYK